MREFFYNTETTIWKAGAFISLPLAYAFSVALLGSEKLQRGMSSIERMMFAGSAMSIYYSVAYIAANGPPDAMRKTLRPAILACVFMVLWAVWIRLLREVARL